MPARSVAAKNTTKCTISTNARTIGTTNNGRSARTIDDQSSEDYNDQSDVSEIYREEPIIKRSRSKQSITQALSRTPSDDEPEEYKHLNDIEHIIQCKGMYLGAFRNSEQNVYTASISPKLKLTKEKTVISTGLLKMFDELAMNAVDQISKSGRGKNRLTSIAFDVNNDGWFGCTNDGKGIPIKIFPDDDRYIPEVLFTQPKSGSNFKEIKEGAGQNGIGIKLTSIMSSDVEILVVDPSNEYRQSVSNNCRTINAPVIRPIKGAHQNVVQYRFKPDLRMIDDQTTESAWKDVLVKTSECMIKRILDIRALIDSSIMISINGTTIDPFPFEIYASKLWRAYLVSKGINTMDEYANRYHIINRKDIKLFIGLSPAFEHISYVNGISVEKGGAHIKMLTDTLNRDFKERLKTKNSIKSRFFICMNLHLISPEFSSQAKTELTAASNLSSIVKLGVKDLNTIFTTLRLDELFNERRQEKVNKLFSSRKVTRDCPKLMDAEQAGKRKAFNTLFICEGDSASSLAKIGMTCPNIGHKNFGCLPLQGKIDNIRGGKDKLSKILKNPEEADDKLKKNIITQILLTLGATPNRVYTTSDELRYQRIVVLKDADTDGANILALVYNAFDVLFDTVLRIPGFFCEFITPMIKVHISAALYKQLLKPIKEFGLSGTIVTHNSVVTLPFYNKPRYEVFMEAFGDRLPRNTKVEYVKGLAGHQQYEIKEYFKEYKANVIHIDYTDDTGSLLEKTFSKAAIAPAIRREWMNELPKEGASLERVSGTPITMSDFLNTDHLQYMYDSAFRVLPSAIDGLKQVQRKIIYGLRKQSNPYEFRKVFQVAGAIANTANYHHGDQSLNAAIINMAQDYPGSNNIPLLAGKGFFGSRLELGDDAGQPRYIDVCISKITDILFPKIDDDLLDHITEDNTVVEPYNYVPIVPILLINGCTAIGTGYACNIYKHSAMAIIQRIKDRLHGKKKLTPLEAHINGWNGDFQLTEKSMYYLGSFVRKNDISIHLTEIPILNRINDLMTILNTSDMVDKWKNLNTESINAVSFEITFKQPIDDETVTKILNLTAFKPNASTRCGINKDGHMVYYDSMESIFDEWFSERYDLYVRRKDKLIAALELAILILKNKIRFIKEVIAKEIRINCLSNEELEGVLTRREYYRHNDSFDYLLTMHMSSMTLTNLSRLEKELKAKISELNELRATTIEVLWERELDTLIPHIKDLE